MASNVVDNVSESTAKRLIVEEKDVQNFKKARLDVTQESPRNEEEETTKNDNSVQQSLQLEEDVGITKYIGTHKGFSGILKERYSDFLVNEVALNGDLVKLTQLDLPKDEIVEGNVDELRTIIGVETVENLIKLKNGDEKEDIKIKVSDLDKNERKKIHESIRKCFQVLSSNTVDEGNDKFIAVSLSREDGRRKRSNWPSLRPDYTHFVLYKENKDTMDAINTIAGILRMKPGAFSYAGTKDKRAKSSQNVSVYRVEGNKLITINQKQKNITIGNIQYKNKAIALGDLSGNQFIIILRNVSGSDGDIGSAISSLKLLGFVNYYGMQRFGTTTVPTHRIGRALILGKWKEAVELILQPRQGEDENTTLCRKIWWETKDVAAAFEKLHKKGSIEGQLLKSLLRQSNNWVGALDGVPRNTRLMYLHSYQSWIWNQVVSRRIENHGLQVLEGDLILSVSERAAKNVPKTVTADNVAGEKFSIYDVVLPLPGYQINYPNNEVAEWYKDILMADGLDLESFRSRVRSYSLGGSYRHMVVRPENVSWELLRYDDPIQALVLSDRDILQNEQLPSTTDATRYLAVKLQMCLPASSYATVAVRELMKRNVTVWNKKL